MQRGLLAAILVVLVIIAVAVIAIALRPAPPQPPGFPTIDPTFNAQIDSTIQAVYATNTAVRVQATQTAAAR